MLVCIVTDYLKDAPYPGAIKAGVTDGRKYTEYLLLYEEQHCGCISCGKKPLGMEVQEQPQRPAGSNDLPDKEPKMPDAPIHRQALLGQ